MPATSIKQVIQSCTTESTGLFYGRVIKVSPLTIELQNDSNQRVSEALLIVPEHLKDKDYIVDINGEENTITLKNALKKDDNVIILSINNGNLYLIVGRA